MKRDLLLAIDNGTQSVRALVFDLEGHLLAKERVPIEIYVSDAPGLSELPLEPAWGLLCQATRALVANHPDLIPRLAGAALTTQRGTTVNLDREGRPLRHAITWLDQRRTEGLPPVGGLWGLAFRLTGMTDTVAYLQAEAEANWIRTHQPDIWAATEHYAYFSGYLIYKLTGRWVDSVAAQVGYQPFDYKHMRWSSSWDWKWQAVPMPRRILPTLLPPGARLGEITPAAAADTGLPVGLPLIAAASDKACEVLGAGCLEPHIGCLSYGTSATINTIHRRYHELIPLIPPYGAAVPGAYSLEVQIFRGFWMVSWFKEEFGQLEQWLAAEQGVEPESLFDKLLEAVPPGSQGLLLQPYWSPGLKSPGPEARGAIIGFGDVHTRAHLYRAILEGLAYALREGAERTARRTGIRVEQLRVAGGGSQSDAAMQLTADVFNRPTSRPHLYETSGLGAAIDAAVGLGLHPSFDAAITAMTRLRDTFEPNPTAARIYDELYRQVYRRMYPRLRPLYQEIRRITQPPDSH
jgi:sugar (pentulose or hexulose) kinase